MKPWVSPSGAKRSKLMQRFDLIPLSLLECLADRLELGANNPEYGEFNWQRATTQLDYEYIRDAMNHVQHHLTSLINKDGAPSEETEYGDLGAIMFGCMVYLEYLRHKKGSSSEFGGSSL